MFPGAEFLCHCFSELISLFLRVTRCPLVHLQRKRPLWSSWMAQPPAEIFAGSPWGPAWPPHRGLGQLPLLPFHSGPGFQSSVFILSPCWALGADNSRAVTGNFCLFHANSCLHWQSLFTALPWSWGSGIWGRAGGHPPYSVPIPISLHPHSPAQEQHVCELD